MRCFRVFLPALLALWGCASPSIVIEPSVPTPEARAAAGPNVDVRLNLREAQSPAARFEEKREKTLLGRSESLGVHLSDFWMEEPAARFVQRLLESHVKSWGHRVVADNEQVQLRGQVNRLSLNSKAISAFEFQADGAIDVELEVVPKDAAPRYRRQYVATCTFRTATSIPNKDNMDKMFNNCVADFQKRIAEDGALRAAVSGPR